MYEDSVGSFSLRPTVRARKAGAFLLRRAPPAVAASLARLRERECELGFRAARFPFRVDFLGWTRTACLCDTTSIWVGNRPTFRRVVATFASFFQVFAAFACQFLLKQVGDCPSYCIEGFCFPCSRAKERGREEEELFARRIIFLLLFLSLFVSCGLFLWPFPGPAKCDDELLWHRSVLSS
jgi:hypothetical protein